MKAVANVTKLTHVHFLGVILSKVEKISSYLHLTRSLYFGRDDNGIKSARGSGNEDIVQNIYTEPDPCCFFC